MMTNKHAPFPQIHSALLCYAATKFRLQLHVVSRKVTAAKLTLLHANIAYAAMTSPLTCVNGIIWSTTLLVLCLRERSGRQRQQIHIQCLWQVASAFAARSSAGLLFQRKISCCYDVARRLSDAYIPCITIASIVTRCVRQGTVHSIQYIYKDIISGLASGTAPA